MLPYSVEVTVPQANSSEGIKGLFRKGTDVYIPDIGKDDFQSVCQALKNISEAGYNPVPHIVARRIQSFEVLEHRLSAMSGAFGVNSALVIAGGVDKPVGVFSSSIELLRTGLFDKYGIKHIGVSGYPDGSPDFSSDIERSSLLEKNLFSYETNADIHLVTQFCFDVDKIKCWVSSLPDLGVNLPVHVGIVGPASIATLIKYASACGVKNSFNMVKKRSSLFTNLFGGYSHNDMLMALEDYKLKTPRSLIEKVHIFPFGGLKKTSEWVSKLDLADQAPVLCQS